MKIIFDNRFNRAVYVVLAGLFFSCISCSAGPPEGPVDPVGETPLETGWQAVTVTGGLMRPWSAVWLPDGKTLLITEREGQLRVLRGGELRMDAVKGVPDLLPLGQGGLLDIALHPDFAENRWVYMTCSTGQRQANRTTLVRGRINDALTELTEVTTCSRFPGQEGDSTSDRACSGWMTARCSCQSAMAGIRRCSWTAA